jgi:hypothetical protein
MIPHIAFPAITIAALEAELARELEARRGFYPGRVGKGNMLQAEADRELALAAAWLEDVARIRACWFDRPGTAPAAPQHGFAWQDRRAGLLRELGLRRRLYPQWVAGGRLLADQAAQRIACLACLLALYEDGWDWRGSDGRTPHHSPLAEREYAALRAEVDAREGRSQQEMAL